MKKCQNFWDKNAERYNRFMRKDAAAYAQLYELLYPVVRGKTVLELATGTGLIAKNIVSSAAHIEATDASSEMIAEAKRDNQSVKLHFSVQDMFHLPYADGSFDVIVVANALHIVPEPEKALSEIRRVLKDDGVLVAPTFTHADNALFGKVKAFFMRLAGFPLHSRWTGAEYPAFLRENGWTVRKSTALKASFPLTYAECVKSEGAYMKEKIKLSGVPETMLQTVYARAKESGGRGAIHDAKAEEIIENLDYDFFLAEKDTAMRSGVIARTIVLDRLTKAWLGAHPGAVVVNIACGLDTRCYRMSGYAHWYNLDLPETMAVREKLLPESGAFSQIAMSAMDDWGGKISEQNVPVLIIIEGLTMYLSERDVQRIFEVISNRFSKATVFVETMNPMIVKRFKEKSIEGSGAKFTWGIKNGKALAELLPDFRFAEEHSLTEGMAEFVPIYKLPDKLPVVRNISNKIIVLKKEG